MAEAILLGILENVSPFKENLESIKNLLKSKGISLDNVTNVQQEYQSLMECCGQASETSPSVTLPREDLQSTNPLINKNIISFGGYGVVFKAKHQVDKKIYAVKVQPLKKNRLKEVEFLRKLKHKNIIRYYNSWIQYGMPPATTEHMNNHEKSTELVLYHKPRKIPYLFIQTEYCPYTLEDWLKYRPIIPSTEDVVKQLVKVVQFLHKKGIVHGDLKPANIFIKGKTVKLGDFGLSKKHLKFSKDMQQLALIFFEIFYPMKTQSERFKVFADLKAGIFPIDFPVEFEQQFREMLGIKLLE